MRGSELQETNKQAPYRYLLIVQVKVEMVRVFKVRFFR